MRGLFLRFIFALLIALTLDGLTKAWVERALTPGQPVSITGEFLQLTLNYNTGIAIGLFATRGPWVLVITGLIIIALVGFVIRSLRERTLTPASAWLMGLLIGGALGNFADRLPDRRITDFLDMGVASLRWPTFNLADSFIVAAVVGLVLLSARELQSQETAL